MMTINGCNISFDMDVREDYARFVKAHETLQRKRANTKGSFDDGDMENFLRGCIKKAELEPVLEDNRISTLAKAFAEFFNQAVDQLDAVLGTYNQTADLISETYEKLNSLKLDMDGLQEKMPPDVMAIGETDATNTSAVGHDGLQPA